MYQHLVTLSDWLAAIASVLIVAAAFAYWFMPYRNVVHDDYPVRYELSVTKSCQ